MVLRLNMNYKDFVTSFVRGWNHTRQETLEILTCLNNEQLQFRPQGAVWQPLYYQFNCIGITQLIYTEAIKTGKMNFSLFKSDLFPEKDEFQTVNSLREFLGKTDSEWTSAIRNRREEEEFKVKWPGFNMALPNHISALMSHERLHHGQFISYFTIAGFELPKNFKSNWAL